MTRMNDIHVYFNLQPKNFDWGVALLVEGFQTMMMMMHFCYDLNYDDDELYFNF